MTYVINPTAAASKIVFGVDDAPENRFLLQAAVKAGGYTFMGAEKGAECLTMLSRVTPRLIFLDIEMPEMDGFETCSRIRSMFHMKHIPIAFLTARKTEDDVRRCLAVGGNDFIVKPFEIPKLLERIKHWTSRRVG
jgi:two-component system sensor histidine kinase/response regulator